MDAKATGETDTTGRTKKDWLVFGGADYLATKIVLGITVVGSVMYGFGVPVADAARNAPLAVSYMTKLTSGIQLPRGATHDGQVTMELLLKDASLGERLVQALPGLLSAVVTIAVVWQLFQLLRTTQAGDPFTRRNVRRIYTIAFIIGFGWTPVMFAQGMAVNAMYVSDRVPRPSHPTFTLPFTLVPLVVMLVILLIGEAFRRGVELRDDVEGLV
jgi:hypothetical protein